jgi:hypothetical protein
MTAIQHDAGWEIRSPAKSICRWFVSWAQLGNDRLSGAVAGYSGGGAFQVERFYATIEEGDVKSLWIDTEDKISGEEVAFDDLPEGVLVQCENCLDHIWDWNDHDVWSETDEVVLIQSMHEHANKVGDMYLHATIAEPFVKFVCEKAGLTAAPK